MDITKEIELRAQELQKKLELLRDNKIQHLVARKEALRKELEGVESDIKATCEILGINLGDGKAQAKPETRNRMSGEEIRTRIIKVLTANPQGVSQTDLACQSGVSYASVINFIKANPEKIRTEGERKTKRLFQKLD